MSKKILEDLVRGIITVVTHIVIHAFLKIDETIEDAVIWIEKSFKKIC